MTHTIQMTKQIAMSTDPNLSFCLLPLSCSSSCISVYASVPRCKNSKQRCFPTNIIPPCQNQDIKHHDRKTRGREKRRRESGIKMSDHRGVSGSLLQGIYSCRCVCLSGVDSELLGPGGDSQVLYGSCRAWAVLMAAWGYWKQKVCVYELETVVPLE